jgi:hypothetical protein
VVQIEKGSWDPSGWERVGKGVESPKNHTMQEGALGGFVIANTFGETLVGMLQARENY